MKKGIIPKKKEIWIRLNEKGDCSEEKSDMDQSLGRHLWASNHSPKPLLPPQPTQNLNVFDEKPLFTNISKRILRGKILKWK